MVTPVSVDAIGGITPASAQAVEPPSGVSPTTPSPQSAFSAVLDRHLSQPRSDISSIRSEIAAIRAGAPFFAGRSAEDLLSASTPASTASSAGFSQMPGWLDEQLAAQATGNAEDPYGWRQMSRTLAEQIVGPGYGPLFERQMDQESGFAPDVVYGKRVSSAGAEGIAQLMPQYYANVDRLDPQAGLTAGAQTMRHYLSAWDGDVRKALASYNAGLGRVQALVDAHGDQWESALPEETRNYLNAIVGPAQPTFDGLVSDEGAVFGGRGPGGVLTSPMQGIVAQRGAGESMEFFGAAGATVQAPADGVVVEASAGGIVIDHGNGWRSTLQGVDAWVGVGASVQRSQAVGALGSAGQLRLGVTVDGEAVSPSRYLLNA